MGRTDGQVCFLFGIVTGVDGPIVCSMSTIVTPAATQAGSRTRLLSWPVIAWGLWDWGSAAFNAVITTFVFTVYLVSGSFGPKADNESALSIGLAIAGLFIALLAPVTGHRSDRAGRTVFWLGGYTAVVVAVSAALFLVRPQPGYLWLGVVLLGIGNIFFELASVNYNAILNHLASKDRIGAVSGLGWGMGYLGGIVLLLVLYIALVGPSPLISFPAGSGMGVRVAMLVSAVWFGLSALPVLINRSRRLGRPRAGDDGEASEGLVAAEPGRDRAGMEIEPEDAVSHSVEHKESILTSYKLLWATLLRLRGSQPQLLWFLLAAAVFRDGLAGVFTYGGIIAQNTFGFSSGDVIIFAIVANVVAGIATIGAGRLDDRFGPRNVIMASLTILVVAGLLVFLLHTAGAVAFWVLGLLLSACVGPAQSAARSFLARLIPEGQEGEIFGLYATTGRAVSFMAPMMYGVFIYLGTRVVGPGASYWGILGIVSVLASGLLLMLRVGDPVADEASTS